MGSKVLLPCPECGGIPELKEEVRSVPLVGIKSLFPVLCFKYKVLCRCGNSMESPEVAHSKAAKSEAINKLIHEWNRKAIVPEYWHK